jgi:N-acetylneuraminic acid mutarotase
MQRTSSCRQTGAMLEPLEDRTFFSASLVWHNAASMPVRRGEGGSFVADGKLYCVGGFDDAIKLTISNEMDAYNPETNKWTRMADCPVKVNDNPIAVDPVTDTAWCGGFFLNDGYHASGLMYEYHVKTNTWTQGPSLPTNIGVGQMGVVGRTLYYFGGRDSHTIGTTAMWKLNLDHPTKWVSDTPLPFKANHLGAVVLNNKIYAIGGIVDKELYTTNATHVQVFDPTTDKWSFIAPMPIGLGHIGSAVTVANGDIIVVGGQINGKGETFSNAVLQYDPKTNHWTRLANLPNYRASSLVGYLDGELIVTGGNQYQSPYVVNTTWVAAYGKDADHT